MSIIDTAIIGHVSMVAMAINHALCRVSGSVVAVESNEIRGQNACKLCCNKVGIAGNLHEQRSTNFERNAWQ